MTYEFITTTDDLEEIKVAKAELKRENSVIRRLADEADKLFGKNNWVQVPDYNNSLDNVTGWYARQANGYQTLEVRIERT